MEYNSSLTRFAGCAAAGMVVTLMLFGAPRPAMADPADWRDTFLLRGQGFDDPLVRLGFNPCPDPPKILLSDQTKPEISLPNSDNPFQILFGIADDRAMVINAPGVPDALGNFSFQILEDTSRNPLFNVSLGITSSSGGVPMDWIAFVPDLDAPFPGDHSGAAQIGFDFNYSSLSTAFLTLQITDPNGNNPLSLTQVPNPSTLALMAVGLFGLARRRGKRL